MPDTREKWDRVKDQYGSAEIDVLLQHLLIHPRLMVL